MGERDKVHIKIILVEQIAPVAHRKRPGPVEGHQCHDDHDRNGGGRDEGREREGRGGRHLPKM